MTHQKSSLFLFRALPWILSHIRAICSRGKLLNHSVLDFMSVLLITAISSLSVFILARLLAIIAVVGKSGALLGLLFADC
jgi:hypothetical protein